MSPVEDFKAGEAISHQAETLNINHLLSDGKHLGPASHGITGASAQAESSALVRHGVLPSVELTEDKHPKKKDGAHQEQHHSSDHGPGHGTGHGGNPLKHVKISKQQGELITGVATTVLPGGPLVKLLVPIVKHKLEEKHKDHKQSGERGSHPDDPLYKLKHEGKDGGIKKALKKFHLPKF
ncbi:MAG: hypothetical protein JST01_20015 [Cyanobacteria bacterium SZAS TMP-1]|nr:hypothetical protein [Cyanobacteria bacterium SZAS TMP-1]